MAATRHNLSRRAVLGAGVVAPAFLAVPAAASAAPGPQAPVPSLHRRWSRALAGFRRSEARLAAFRAHAGSLPPERREFPACEPLEDRFDALESARLAHLRRLLAAPAPDLPALALKIDLILADQAWELTGVDPCLAALQADARRLCLGGRANGPA